MPDDINDNVRSLIETEWIRLEGALFKSLLTQSDRAQQLQDDNVFRQEERNLNVMVQGILANNNTVLGNKRLGSDNEEEEFSTLSHFFEKNLNSILNSHFVIADDRLNYGSASLISINNKKRLFVENTLKQIYQHDKNLNRNTAIESAHNGNYFWKGKLGEYGEEITIHLSPNHYSEDYSKLVGERYVGNQKEFMSRTNLEISQVDGAGGFLSKYGIWKDGKLALDIDAVDKNEELLNIFRNKGQRHSVMNNLLNSAYGLLKQDEKNKNGNEELLNIFRNKGQRHSVMNNLLNSAYGLLKQDEKNKNGDLIDSISQNRILANEDNQTKSWMATKPEERFKSTFEYGKNNNPTDEQLAQYKAQQLVLNRFLDINDSIKDQSPTDIEYTLNRLEKNEIIGSDSHKIQPFVRNTKRLLVEKLKKRLIALNSKHLDLAFEESGELEKIKHAIEIGDADHQIDFNNIKGWYNKKFMISNFNDFVPESLKNMFKTNILEAKEVGQVFNQVNLIKTLFSDVNSEKAFFEVQQTLPNEWFAFLDLPGHTIKRKAEIFDILKDPDFGQGEKISVNRRQNINGFIASTLENSFVSQFEKLTRKNKHVELVEKLLSFEALRNKGEYSDKAALRIMDDLYGGHTAVRMGSSVKVVHEKADLNLDDITPDMISESKSHFFTTLVKQNGFDSIGIQGLDGKKLDIDRVKRSALGEDATVWTGLVSTEDGGLRMVLMSGIESDPQSAYIAADITVKDKYGSETAVRYTKQQALDMYQSARVAEWADAQNDWWDKINVLGKDMSRDLFFDIVKNKHKYPRKHYLSANQGFGILVEVADPGQSEIRLFIEPLVQDIKILEKKLDRKATDKEVETLFDKRLETYHTFEDKYLAKINDKLREMVLAYTPKERIININE